MLPIEQEFYEVLKRLSDTHNTNNLVLIGSFATIVYRDHFHFNDITLRTKDIDFSVLDPRHIKKNSSSPNVTQVLLEMGYRTMLSMISESQKYVPEESRHLEIEFLCEPGRHIQEPTEIKELGIKVTPLKYQRVLLNNAELMNYRDIRIKVPKPEYWAAHKIAISQMRKKPEKADKDLSDAHRVIKHIGIDIVIQAAGHYPGKFEKSFKQGLEQYRRNLTD